MERTTYTIDDLKKRIEAYEEKYGITTSELKRRHLADETHDVPNFDRHVWLSYAREVEEHAA